MPILIPAEAACDHCGKTAPCKLDSSFSFRTVEHAGRTYEAACVAIRGLPTWFWRDNGVACSEACKQALEKEPRFSGYSGKWGACG